MLHTMCIYIYIYIYILFAILQPHARRTGNPAKDGPTDPISDWICGPVFKDHLRPCEFFDSDDCRGRPENLAIKPQQAHAVKSTLEKYMRGLRRWRLYRPRTQSKNLAGFPLHSSTSG